MAPNAGAQCRATLPAKAAGAGFLTNSPSLALMPAAFQEADQPEGHPGWATDIVGLWRVTFTAKTMNGAPIDDTVIDKALVTWHGDGTELMNSRRPPQDGNFCMGVWKRTGEFTYKLNHFAWGANDYAPGVTPPGVVGDPNRGGVHAHAASAN